MRTIVFTIALFGIVVILAFQPDFLSEQKKYPRVRTAYEQKEKAIKTDLKNHSVDINSLNILIVAFKAEQKLILYAKNKNDGTYKKISTYDICSSSGGLGPKRKQGDGQVPEGFYHIDRFNPSSSFYLSLGIDYPNQSDKKKSKASNLGGDIFIHGDCVTIGCMPMTDEKIKEIYIYALQAYQIGQKKIPVYIFPFEMTNSKLEQYKSNSNIAFWRNLKKGYDTFNKSTKELNIVVNEQGDYVFNN